MIVTSAVTRIGLDELARELIRRIPARPVEPDAGPRGRRRGRRTASSPSTACSALRRGAASGPAVGEGSYRVSGTGIERLVARYDLDNEDALAHLERRLRGSA